MLQKAFVTHSVPPFSSSSSRSYERATSFIHTSHHLSREHSFRALPVPRVISNSAAQNEDNANFLVDSPESFENAIASIGSLPDTLSSEPSTTTSPSETDQYSSEKLASQLLSASYFVETIETDDDSETDRLEPTQSNNSLLDDHSNATIPNVQTTNETASFVPPPATEPPPFFPTEYEPAAQDLKNENLRTKISSVQARRRRVARLAGTDRPPVSPTPVPDPGEESPELAALLEREQYESQLRWRVETTKTASIVSVHPLGAAQPYSALTSVAPELCRLNSQAPFQPMPFPAMRKAFLAANSVHCALCTLPVLKTAVQAGHFCASCYAKIFVEIDSPTAPLPQHKSLEAFPPHVRKIADDFWRRAAAEKRKYNGASFAATSRAAAETDAEPWRAPPSMSSDAPAGPAAAPPFRADASATTQRKFDGGRRDLPPPPARSNGGGAGGRSDEWVVKASDRSLRTVNPIRNLVQGIDVEPNPAKELIKLSVGDPTLYGNLKVGQESVEKYCAVIRDMQSNGYSLSMGSAEARAAVAARYTTPAAPLTADDVVLTSGTSGALELAIGALANEGDNILVPRPGFPLFRTIAEGFGVECRSYALLPNQRWEIDLGHLAGLADARTTAIVVNNPSNPCGSVFSRAHIRALLAAAAALRVPVIADEVYADMAFAGAMFASVAGEGGGVPVLAVGGASKQFVAPGWRLGWLLVHDRGGAFARGGVRQGLRQLTTRMLVANTPAQAVLPTLLRDGASDKGFRAVMRELETNAQFTVQALADAPGLRCIPPQGAMYAMVEVDAGLLGFDDDMHFTRELLREESVFVLPGQCFQAPNFIRVVFCAPQVVLSEAFHRIRSFCARHAGVL